MGCRAFDLHAGPDAPGPVERQRGAEVRSLRICGARGGVESKNRRIEIRSSAQPAASCFVRPRFSNARNREFTPCELAAFDAVSPSVLRLPVRPGRGHFYEGGVTKAFFGKLR